MNQYDANSFGMKQSFVAVDMEVRRNFSEGEKIFYG